MRQALIHMFRSALVVAVILCAMAIPARAQAVGATDVDITLPDIVILHFFSAVAVTITNADLGTYLTGTAGDSTIDEAPHPALSGGFTHDLLMVPNALTGDPAAAVLILQNAWAVRAISLAGGTDTQLAITNTGGTLDHATTAATISLTALTVNDGTSNAATISFTTPGLVTPVQGDVELTLDLTAAINAGDYLNGQYTLTATNI